MICGSGSSAPAAAHVVPVLSTEPPTVSRIIGAANKARHAKRIVSLDLGVPPPSVSTLTAASSAAEQEKP